MISSWGEFVAIINIPAPPHKFVSVWIATKHPCVSLIVIVGKCSLLICVHVLTFALGFIEANHLQLEVYTQYFVIEGWWN